LENSEYDSWRFEKDAKTIRDKIRSLDNKFFKECRCIYTNGRTTAKRLKHYNGFDSEPLFPPPNLADRIYPGDYGQRIIYIGRLEPNKRPDLLISAASLVPRAKMSIIGRGRREDDERLKTLIKEMGVSDRCEILGYLTDEDLLRRLSEARAIFLAKKPVITCDDSGEVKLFVEETGSGFVSDTSHSNIAANLAKVYDMTQSELVQMASYGCEVAKGITWDKILNELVLNNL